MMTFGNIAKVSTTAAMAGIGQSQNNQNMIMTKQETQAMAIGKVAESNIIQPKDDSEDKKGIGVKKMSLNKQTYNAMGQLGMATAMKRAGADINKII
jgi:hypothetical protein